MVATTLTRPSVAGLVEGILRDELRGTWKVRLENNRLSIICPRGEKVPTIFCFDEYEAQDIIRSMRRENIREMEVKV